MFWWKVLIDSHSKWLEVHPVNAATSAMTIEKLRFIFSTHGLPDMIVSDNGSVFTSKEFSDFMTHTVWVYISFHGVQIFVDFVGSLYPRKYFCIYTDSHTFFDIRTTYPPFLEV